MKVGHLENKPPLAPAGAECKPAPRADHASAGEASARVDLSDTAAALAGGVDASFDSAKVERIALAIRDGKFEVNAEAIADKLIANAQDLLGRAQGTD